MVSRLSSFLRRHGFQQSQADPSLFILSLGQVCYVLSLYVDDSPYRQSFAIQPFISILNSEFGLKDLGSLHYFIGIEVQHASSGVQLTQTKYALNLLKRTNMLDCKPATTHFASRSQLSNQDGTPFSDPTEFHHLLGALQYLTLTHPDTAFMVNHIT